MADNQEAAPVELPPAHPQRRRIARPEPRIMQHRGHSQAVKDRAIRLLDAGS